MTDVLELEIREGTDVLELKIRKELIIQGWDFCTMHNPPCIVMHLVTPLSQTENDCFLTLQRS